MAKVILPYWYSRQCLNPCHCSTSHSEVKPMGYQHHDDGNTENLERRECHIWRWETLIQYRAFPHLIYALILMVFISLFFPVKTHNYINKCAWKTLKTYNGCFSLSLSHFYFFNRTEDIHIRVSALIFGTFGRYIS